MAESYFSYFETKYDTFQNIFNFYFNQAFPKTIVKKKHFWMTEELKEIKEEIKTGEYNSIN